MATTYIRGEKVYRSHTREYTVHAILKYVFNPDKTQDGKWVSGFLCDGSSYEVCEDEFLRRQAIYENITGRKVHINEHSNVIISMRQSFHGSECSPAQAQKIGNELAHTVFGEQFQFVVATHTNTKNIHNHIIANIVSEENRKYHFTKATWKEVRRYSDRLCREHGLSIISDPTVYHTPLEKRKAQQYTLQRSTNWNEQLRHDVDRTITQSKSYDDFLQRLQKDYEIKQGKYLSLRNRKNGQQRFRRLYQLGLAYTEDGIRQRIFALQHPVIQLNKQPIFLKLEISDVLRVKNISYVRRMTCSYFMQWQMIKKTMEACSVYARYDIQDATDLKNRLSQEKQIVTSLRTQVRKLFALEPLLVYMEDFKNNEALAKEYETISDAQERIKFYQEYKEELDRFDDARNYFLDSGTSPNDSALLEKMEKEKIEIEDLKRLQQELKDHEIRLKDYKFAYYQLDRFDRHYHMNIEAPEKKKLFRHR